ncbi:MAG TPA: alcohol dehydrogenase catalytic domain-containing protein [Actinomycetes bacterium]|jgi:(R,R)-butanediol dehydrogenase/meso-butanediol dehydrogenase/diacetyl reductase|nr:alcohol dehydrogenase catalytic domain-containing protein [Actinomycetes bacterium]
MRAAVFYGAGDVRVEERPAPRPAAGELLIEVHAAGICGTDAAEFADGPSMFPLHQRHPFSGHLGPMVPGHELAGRVVSLGEGVEGFTVGEVVASAATVWCGACRWCRVDRTNLCERSWTVGLHRDGGLAELCAVPARSCRPVASYGLTEDAAALAQPMAIAVHAVGRGRPGAAEHALVLGVGGIGAFVTWVAVRAGMITSACDLDPERLAVAEALGAASTLRAERGAPLAEALRGLPAQLDVVYEVTGSEEGIAAALEVVVDGGRVVVVGLQHRPQTVDLRRLALRELGVIGSQALVCPTDLPEALRLLAARPEGWADVAPIALSLDRLADEGLVPLAEGRAPGIKTLVDPRASASRPTRMELRKDPGATDATIVQ